jgi:hypothetical protein
MLGNSAVQSKCVQRTRRYVLVDATASNEDESGAIYIGIEVDERVFRYMHFWLTAIGMDRVSVFCELSKLQATLRMKY